MPATFTYLLDVKKDPALSIKAKGVALVIEGMKRFTVLEIAALVPDGRTGVRTAFGELAAAGYIQLVRGHNGQHADTYWVHIEKDGE